MNEISPYGLPYCDRTRLRVPVEVLMATLLEAEVREIVNVF